MLTEDIENQLAVYHKKKCRCLPDYYVVPCMRVSNKEKSTEASYLVYYRFGSNERGNYLANNKNEKAEQLYQYLAGL